MLKDIREELLSENLGKEELNRLLLQLIGNSPKDEVVIDFARATLLKRRVNKQLLNSLLDYIKSGTDKHKVQAAIMKEVKP